MVSRVHYSSATDEWGTPRELFDKYLVRYALDLDVCATPGREMLPRYFSPEQDGLKQPWGKARCWMNPPYGRKIKHWVKKAAYSALDGALVVGLLPARTDTEWWHEYVLPFAAVEFLRGRVKFVAADGRTRYPAPFPSAIVIWWPTVR